jgi:hypothetical protein
MCIFVVLLFYVMRNILFYMCEYSDAIKLPKSYSPPPPLPPSLGGQGLQIKSFPAGKRGK